MGSLKHCAEYPPEILLEFLQLFRKPFYRFPKKSYRNSLSSSISQVVQYIIFQELTKDWSKELLGYFHD